jgi:hypothetical protein
MSMFEPKRADPPSRYNTWGVASTLICLNVGEPWWNEVIETGVISELILTGLVQENISVERGGSSD